jgi:hypothetical protein
MPQAYAARRRRNEPEGRRIKLYLIPSSALEASYGGPGLHSFSEGGLGGTVLCQVDHATSDLSGKPGAIQFEL